MQFVPHDYQQRAIDRIVENRAAGLFLDMGLGKTAITLTAIEELMYTRFAVQRVLIIAPLRVAASTWPQEARKWDQLQHLTIQPVLGSERRRMGALKADADIYVINRENVPWLVDLYNGRRPWGRWPFDMVVIDELSSFKSPSALRFRKLKRVLPFAKRVVGLTGTPAPNGYIDLWSQIYLLDAGQALGDTMGKYRGAFFKPGRQDPRRHIVFQWDLLPGAKEQIDERLKPMCVSMQAADYLQMPDRVEVDTPVHLTDAERKLYKKLEREYLITIADQTITASTAAAVTSKLQQFAQGAVYTTDELGDPTGDWQELHQAKLEAMAEIAESAAAAGQNLLVFYWFKHDLQRLKARFPHAKELQTPKDIEDWNAGKTGLLLAHPAAAGHGLNLQAGGSRVIWFAVTWNLELYQQANARLYRQGQRDKTVCIEHLVAAGTVDEDILAALKGKAEGQEELLQALKARIRNAQEGS